MADDFASPPDVGGDERGVEPGHPILDAVDEAFEPRPPRFRAPSDSESGPVTEPVALRKRNEDPPASLFGPSPAERREELSRLLARGVGAREVEAVGRVLTSDPDPEVRRQAALGLAASGHRLPLSVLAIALADPYDRVRRQVVPLVAARGRESIPLLLPLTTERRSPMTQAAVLHVLPEVIRSEGSLRPPELGGLLAAVATLDPPPLLGERSGLADLARAVGPSALIRALSGRDIRRLGAARLLALTGLPAADRALAALVDDPAEEIRQLARIAGRALHTGGEEAPEPTRWIERQRSEAARPGGPLISEPSHAEPMLIASLARALVDPGEPVRAQARAALVQAPRDIVTEWALGTLERASGEAPEFAALVVGMLKIVAAASWLLRRAAATNPEGRGPYLGALQALALDPAELARLVSGVDPEHRQTAVRLAWQVGGQALLPHLSSLLDDSAGSVRMAVIEVLTESGDPAGTAIARERLVADSSAGVRATAVHALAGSEPATRLDALARALSDPDPDVRATAVEALPNGAEGMVDLLGPAFLDQDERVWRAAMSHLAALPRRDLPVVWTILRRSPPPKREELIGAIESLDPDRLFELAANNARAPSSEDRALAVTLAGRAGSPEATALVVAALEDPDPVVRRTAAAAMATLRAPGAVPALSRSLLDPQAEVRTEAIRALGLIDDDTVPGVLIGALRDPEVRVREMAAEALARWHSPAVARRLAAALATPDLRRPAGEVLERMGTMAVEALATVAAGPDVDAATAAGVLLDRMVGPAPFIERLSSIEPETRLEAAHVLAVLGGSAVAEALVSALSDPDVRVRSRAASALGSIGYLPSVKHLRRMFLTDPVAEVASEAEAALRSLGAVPAEGQAPPEEGEEDEVNPDVPGD